MKNTTCTKAHESLQSKLTRQYWHGHIKLRSPEDNVIIDNVIIHVLILKVYHSAIRHINDSGILYRMKLLAENMGGKQCSRQC